MWKATIETKEIAIVEGITKYSPEERFCCVQGCWEYSFYI